MKNIKIDKNVIIVIKSLVLTLIAIFVLELILALMRRMGLNILTDSLIGNVLLESVILIVQILIIRKYSKGKILSSIGFSHKKDCFKYILLGICIGLTGTIVLYFVLSIMKLCTFKGIGVTFAMTNTASLFIRCFFAGICEEVFFRGVLLNYLAKRRGKIFGLIISSIIFVAFHTTRYDTLSQLFNVLIMGIVLGYFYIITKSLYLPIGLHFAMDFFSSVPGIFISDVNTKLEQSLFSVSSIIYSCLLVILILIRLKTKKKA